jgi:thiamine pyrophosphate-dependent acetolactate synthase large subunit-like protein
MQFMNSSPSAPTVAEQLVARLRAHGVRHVFGYPGGQLLPIYDALYHEPAIRHILARDEQAAAFMADGYARATGKPGICLAVCGPGVLNAATPLAASFTDSIPVLLISGQVPTAGLGLRSGYYHENDQLSSVASITKHRARVERPADLDAAVDEAFTALTTGRPGPAFIEIPLDILRGEGSPALPNPASSAVVTPSAEEIAALAALLTTWKKPLLLAGGGVLSAQAGPLLVQMAECLGAPVFTTAMGKGAIPGDHPLSAGLPWRRATSDVSNMASFFSPLFTEADGLLAVGCRFSQLTTGTWCMPLPTNIVHIDVDASEIGRHYAVTLGINADARAALEALLATLHTLPRTPWAKLPPGDPWMLPGIDLAGPLRRALPRDAIVVADITRLAYILLAEFPVYEPRTFLHPAGSVAMGYGIPAALGAKTAFPDRPVVAIVGDGCFLMSGMELATAVQEDLPIVIVLVNDSCLSLIKATQQRRYESRFLAVDLRNPDFALFAKAFGAYHWRADTEEAFSAALAEALNAKKISFIEVVLSDKS